MLEDIIANWPMWVSLAVVVGAITAYLLDRWSMELVSVCVIAVLLVVFELPGTGDIGASTLLAGFGNEALITIMALLVVGQALFQTGALEGPTRALLTSYDTRPNVTLLAAFFAVFVISAFINNTPVVIMFLPVMSAIAARMGAAPSRLMMPLSFVSVFAGMTTLIGTSTNLLAANAYERLENETFGFFTQTPMGLVLAGAGMIYLMIASRALIPERRGLSEDIASSSGKQFVAQFEVGYGHFLSGKRAVAGMFPDLPGITVRMVQRGERAFLPPFEDISLQPGDLVIVAATRSTLTDMLARHPELLKQMYSTTRGETSDAPSSLAVLEAVIAPGSRMSGRTVEMVGFRRLTESVVLGVQRRSRMIRAKLGEIRLESGDTLLLCGPPNAFQKLRANRDIILLEWSQMELPLNRRVTVARGLALIMVLLAATNVLPILHASVLAAVSMIALGCLNIRQASRSLDLRIFLIIAAALAMGAALEQTGAAKLIADLVVSAALPNGKLAVLSAIFLAVAILTNILSNAATAVVFSPIAIEAAYLIDSDPTIFVLAVIYGANCCFATPIAYQTNLLVMGPGHYKFSDFLRFGGPLVLLLWAVFTISAPWMFGMAV